MKKMLTAIFFFVFVWGCASTYESVGAKENIASYKKNEFAFPDYKGKKIRIAVFPVSLTKKAVEDYPDYTAELKKKSVGFSLWNKITDNLYETGRFTFVEISEEIVKQIIDQWWLGESGMVDPSAALKMGKLKQAENFVYGEISEFGVDIIEKAK